MANITLSYGEMELAAVQLGAARDEITEKLQRLQQQIQSLVSSGFVTETASQRFEAHFIEYTASASATIDRLGELQSFITLAANAHREVDGEIAARIG